MQVSQADSRAELVELRDRAQARTEWKARVFIEPEFDHLLARLVGLLSSSNQHRTETSEVDAVNRGSETSKVNPNIILAITRPLFRLALTLNPSVAHQHLSAPHLLPR